MVSARFHSVAPLAILALAAAVFVRSDVPTFAPKEGTHVKRTLEWKGTRELLSASMEMGDERQAMPDAYLHIDIGWKHVVTDEYVKCADDRTLTLKRTYASLAKGRAEKSKDKNGADVTKELAETCDLEGKTVVFEWDKKKEEYAKSFDGAGDKAALADLEEDMDYREFLPAADAKVGAKWERDFADLKVYFLRPGGDLPFKSEVAPRPIELRMRAAMWDVTKGKVEFTWKPDTVVEGKHLATIHFMGTNQAEATEDALADEKGPSQLALKDDQTFEGDLFWDATAGRAQSIAFSAKGTMLLKVSGPGRSPSGATGTMVQAFTFDTAYDYTGSFELE